MDTALSESHKAYFEIYFGSQQHYYMEKLREYEAGNRFTINPAAILFGMLWMLYRKMYKAVLELALLVIVQGFAEELVFERLQPSEGFLLAYNFFVLIAFALCFGLIGNYLYLKQAIRKVQLICSQETDEQVIVDRLQKAGGTTMVPFIAILALVLVFLLLNNF